MLGRRTFLEALGFALAAPTARAQSRVPSSAQASAQALAPSGETVRLRGTIEALLGDRLSLRGRDGRRIELTLARDLTVTEVYPVSFETVQSGSFVGVGAMPQPDGTLRAIAVTVFPESMRGTNEGHRPFSFLPQSTMTNATVAGLASAPEGRRMQLRYGDGEKTVVVPAEAPVVSLRPATRELLTVGAQVSLTAQAIEGVPTVTRITAGRNGFAPPY